VLRFELPVGAPQTNRQTPGLEPTGLEATDGPYSIKFDSLDLSAGSEAVLSMHVEKNGKAATDLHPFLGVAAHAVFINANELSYVHVHASPSSDEPTGSAASNATGTSSNAPAMKGMHEMHNMPSGMQNMPGMGSMSGMDMNHMSAMPASAKVASDLSLHVNAPKAGIYALWIQFIGGTEVRTAPFVVRVK
jgi:hypothetical protein